MRILLLVVLIALTGCASIKETPRVSSQALEVARAAHMDRLRDATSTEIAAATRSEPRGSSTAMATIGAGQAAGVFKPPSGMSADAAAGMSMALGFISSLPVGYPEISSRFLIWMPTQMAATREEARDVLREILLAAIAQALPKAEVKFVRQQPGSRIQSHFSIVSPDFPPDSMNFLGLQDFVLPKMEKTPPFLKIEDGNERYTWGHPKKQGDGLVSGFTWSDRTLTPEQQRDFLLDLSSRLPEWIYIYLAPSAGFADYPVLLHQGEVLYFREPGAVEPTLAGAQQPEETLVR